MSAPLFVVGTDTNVGKTVVAALLLRASRRLGRPACYWKPVQTGGDDDTATVRRLSALPADAFCEPALRLLLPASPHEAAAAAGARVDDLALAAALRACTAACGGQVLIVELAGGLLVPYSLEPRLVTQADWLAAERPEVVVVARTALGTLNHTLLTLEALRARGLAPRALFLVGRAHAGNLATLARVGRVPGTFHLPELAPLATAGLDAWLDGHDLAEVLTW